MMTRRRVLQIFAAASAIPGSLRAVEKRQALGADVAITLEGPSELTGPALEQAWATITRIDSLFNLYNADSAISRLNRDGHLDDPAPEFVTLLRLCKRIYQATDGTFDPTVQPLWLAHAARGDITAAMALVGLDRVAVSDDRISLGKEQALTLNGIAQGFATDLVTETLAAAGLTRALVNIGEYRGIDGPWRLGIEDPAFGRIGQITLTDRAVATSSPGAMRLPDGTAHIIDPTGHMAVPEWATVSVCAQTAALADGLSTALCFAPLNRIQTIAARINEPLAIKVVDLAGNLRTI